MANARRPGVRPDTDRYASLVEVVRSNDLVHLSWAQAMLAAEGIDCLLVDGHISSVEGSIGAFPRRLLVLDEERERAWGAGQRGRGRDRDDQLG